MAENVTYKACISKLVPFLDGGGAESWFSLAFISWTGGGLTIVIGITKLSESRPFISLCSWHKAHQCMQQCTMHGSHGEFCAWQNNSWEILIPVEKREKNICLPNHQQTFLFFFYIFHTGMWKFYPSMDMMLLWGHIYVLFVLSLKSYWLIT